MTGAIAPTKPLTALDVCDRCGAQAYVRVLLPNSGELLFCAHHGREHAKALAKVAIDIQDETQRLTDPEKELSGPGLAEPSGNGCGFLTAAVVRLPLNVPAGGLRQR